MRKFVCLFTALLFCSMLGAQDFSNKGKEFWISYPAHDNTTTTTMGVYITSDVDASGTVTVGTQPVSFTVKANNVTRIFIGPSTNPSNASVYLSQADGIKTNAAIHVTANKAVAVYAHIIREARSGATLVLPVSVWGREYIAPSYRHNGSGSYGEINIMAAEPNTVVEITPSIASSNGQHPAGTTFTITLANPGDVYQLQFASGQDISGTRIKSVATATSGCKRIGVYSATTWSVFDCSGAGSGDNLYQQLFPISAWGKNFLTAPFYRRSADIVRVFVNDPTTVVTQTLDGVSTVLSGLSSNGFYEYKTNMPSQISADKPVSVVQYITSQACNVARNGDPEMVVLNPVEQTINNITVFSAHQNYVPRKTNGTFESNVNTCYLNIIIRTSAAASFKINKATPNGVFTPIPGTAYSYLQEDVTGITLTNPVQTLTADSAFSAVAYGFGDVESYGYNAGTNVRDLFQHIIIRNQYATVDFPTTCVNTPFVYAITLPYQAQSLSWDFHGINNFDNVSINAPVPDSSYSIDGRTVYVYRLPKTYTFPATGSYPVTVTAENPTSDGCGGSNQIEYEVEVVNKPSASFNWSHSGCINDTVYFHDTTNAQGRPIIRRLWQFGDNSVASGKDTVHRYATSGSFPVKLSVITDVGCLADTTIPITITPPPVANFDVSAPQCVGTPVTFTDNSTISSGAIAKWYWDYGNGRRDTTTTNVARNVSYMAGSYPVTLQVVSSTGCASPTAQKGVTVHIPPVVNFGVPKVCLSDPFAVFTDSSTIANGSAAALTYRWNFGDAAATINNPNIVTTQNGRHHYTTAGNYTVQLAVTSADGCTSSLSKQVTINGGVPVAAFTVQNTGTLCGADTIAIQNQSTVDFGSITRTEIAWDFATNPTVVQIDDNPLPDKIYRHFYGPITAPSRSFTIRMNAYSGGVCVSSVQKTITVYASPVAAINLNTVEVCQGQPIIASDTGINAGLNVTGWNWQFGDGTTGNSKTIAHPYQAANTYTVQLQNQTADGCTSATVAKQVKINPLPVVNAGFDIGVLEGGQAQIKATVSGSSRYRFTWSPGTWLRDSSVLQPVTLPQADITYRITVTGSGNCTATDEVKVIILQSLVIPNTFSPNGDGINDRWVIESLESYPGATVNVYDRYGKIVFTSKASGYLYWDGTVNGQPLPIGTYYYIIDPKNGRKATTGSVTILR